MNQPTQTYVIGKRSSAQILLYIQEFNGYDLIHIRKKITQKNGDETLTRIGIALHPFEVQELYKVLPAIFRQMTEREEDGSPRRKQDPLPARSKTRPTLSLQNQILLHLVDGLDPEEVRGKVLSDDTEDRTRFMEAGKALRRCGYLPPRSWVPTPEGRDRAKSIRGGGLEDIPGIEIQVMKVTAAEPIPFPGPADISNRL